MSNWASLAPIKRASMTTSIQPNQKPSHTKPANAGCLKNDTLDYKLPVLINNTHADEQPAVDIITGLFNTFATKDTISFRQLISNVPSTLLVSRELLQRIYFSYLTSQAGQEMLPILVNSLIDPSRDTSYQASTLKLELSLDINQ